MRQNLLIIFLLAIILAMAVPFTIYQSQNERAFTYDNLISISPGNSVDS